MYFVCELTIMKDKIRCEMTWCYRNTWRQNRRWQSERSSGICLAYWSAPTAAVISAAELWNKQSSSTGFSSAIRLMPPSLSLSRWNESVWASVKSYIFPEANRHRLKPWDLVLVCASLFHPYFYWIVTQRLLPWMQCLLFLACDVC